MKYGRGFLMAWGCFSWIPCPYKGWHEESRTPMVAMLPLVGTGIGLVTCLIWAAVCGILQMTGGFVQGTGAMSAGEAVLTGAIVTAVYFLMTGFIHLDGFMDVADAVMPRHPRMEERIRILKDPHTGSFAAVSMALMFLLFMGSAAKLSEPFGIWTAAVFVVIVTTSRAMSAVQVITSRPMPTSQYAKAGFGEKGTGKQAAPALVILVIVAAAAVIAVAAGGAMPIIILLAAGVVTALTALIIGSIDRKALGGMNGDISGHLITSSEMAGMIAAALLMA